MFEEKEKKEQGDWLIAIYTQYRDLIELRPKQILIEK